MAKKPVQRIGDLQLAILRVLWGRGEATVAEIHAALGSDSRLAYTTVATMLRKMEARGLATHRSIERRFIYRAAVSEEMVTRGLVDGILDRLFDGSLSGMVSHLLSTRRVSREELRRLEELIARKKKARAER
jgi:BlaI family penicillinase repressor